MSESETAVAPTTAAKLTAEAFGTLLLVLGGVGTAVFASNTFVEGGTTGTVYIAIALAFGLTVLVGVYAFGPISGGHFNPAVTFGLAAAGRLPWKDVWGYVVAQVVGGAVGSTVVFLVALFGPDGFLKKAQDSGFASNGFGEHSPGGFGIGAAMIIETVLAGFFVIVILGATHPKRGTALAGVAIGLTLTLIHLTSIPVTNTSVNPARSIAAAIYGGGDALAQLWVFLVFPIVGGLLAGLAYRALFDGEKA